jgi:hypothetical protein
MTSTAFHLSLVLDTGDQALGEPGTDPTVSRGAVHIHLHLGSAGVSGSTSLPAAAIPVSTAMVARRLPWAGLGVAGTALLVAGYVVGGLGGSRAVSVSAPLPMTMLPQQAEQANLQRALAQPPAITAPSNPPLPTPPAARNAFGLEN